MLELYRQAYAEDIYPEDWRFGGSAITVLGHIGTSDIFKSMRAEIEQPHVRSSGSRDLILHYCRAFCFWGRLDSLPVILDQYLNLRFRDLAELDMLPIYMAEMLLPLKSDTRMQEPPPTDMLEDYLNLVMNRYDEIAAEFGSEQVHVAFGERLSVRSLARQICEVEGRWARFDLKWLRQRFEPMTGIDCSGFFTVEPWTPLAAAVIAEDFLASDACARYEDGARYFFGHRIPD